MLDSSYISTLPNTPAVYAMYGGTGGSRYVAYVGIAGKLKQRITQHLIRRDSSITTGATAVSLNPDKVTEIRWWDHEQFADGDYLAAAEMVAFRVLDPVLRSRGKIGDKAKAMTADSEFNSKMEKLFECESAGHLIVPNLKEALDRIAEPEKKIQNQKSRP
jgi:hypothetical protein